MDDVEGLHLLLPATALKALALPPAPACGPLSPLSRMPMPAGPADPPALRAALEQADAGTALATLLDPGLLVTLLLDDPQQPVLASWIYPDPGGSGEGWRVEVDPDVLGIGGPVRLAEIEAALHEWLDPGGVAALAPLRLGLRAAEAWTLLALVDAWEGLQHLRRGLRLPGPPLALSRGDLLQAWTMAVDSGRCGYASARARWLCPEAVPADFGAALQSVLDTLEQAGLLIQLPGTAERADDTTLLPLGSLAALCRLLAEARGFGLLRAEATPGQIRLDVQLGWRSPAGIALLDLSRLGEDHAELLLCGPDVALALLGHLLATRATPIDADRLRRQLDALRACGQAPAEPPPPLPPASDPPVARHCTRCGATVGTAARYCGSCGARL